MQIKISDYYYLAGTKNTALLMLGAAAPTPAESSHHVINAKKVAVEAQR